jgi:cyclopropane-fatty-acyl-phospholipid synthase
MATNTTNMPTDGTVADTLRPMFDALLGTPAVEFEFWDGSKLGRPDGPGRIRVNSIDALRRIIWSPDELGLARAFVAGDLDVFGPVPEILRALQQSMPGNIRVAATTVPKILTATRALGGIGATPPTPPAEELVPRGRRHSLRRDKQAVSHHYDVGNEFYELVLGPSMTYSCARFVDPDASLEDAQAAKHELVCRKLGLHEPDQRAAASSERPRLLDVGCGWGSMAIHAATHHDVDVVGVTISDEQARYARKRVAEAGLTDRVEIRIQDYRQIDDGPFDAISSIGMAEHVGSERMGVYFDQLYALLRPCGRLLNHAISSVGGSRLRRRGFVARYVFPDGELLDVGDTVLEMERAGFEVRDVENLREHYATTLRNWVDNLQAQWDRAVDLVGERRARVWLLYMSGSINGFDDGGIQLHQTLGVRATADGSSAMPRTRDAWR